MRSEIVKTLNIPFQSIENVPHSKISKILRRKKHRSYVATLLPIFLVQESISTFSHFISLSKIKEIKGTYSL